MVLSINQVGNGTKHRTFACKARIYATRRGTGSRGGLASTPEKKRLVSANAEDQNEQPVKYNTQFGYSRKDVVLIGVGLVALGYALYYGLQATGVEPLMAGNITQLVIFVGLCIGWIGSYVFRVVNKDMTYVTQLKEYEEAVMQKRLEEMTDDEVQKMLSKVEEQKRQGSK